MVTVTATSTSSAVTTTAPSLEGGSPLATADAAAAVFTRVSTYIAPLLDLVARRNCQWRVLC